MQVNKSIAQREDRVRAPGQNQGAGSPFNLHMKIYRASTNGYNTYALQLVVDTVQL